MRGVGFEPTKAYATGSLNPAVDLKSGTALYRLPCPFDLTPALSVIQVKVSGTPAQPLDREVEHIKLEWIIVGPTTELQLSKSDADSLTFS